jgi:hypothetical protein
MGKNSMEGNRLTVACVGNAGLLELVLRKGEKNAGDGRSWRFGATT